jgi:uncharacterized protein (TIGR02594 family)
MPAYQIADMRNGSAKRVQRAAHRSVKRAQRAANHESRARPYRHTRLLRGGPRRMAALNRGGLGRTGARHVGSGSSLVSEARRWIGGNPTGRSSLWCGHFMNMMLKRTGRRGSSSNTARSFASYGRRVSGPQVGAIAVMSRGKRGGHVGVVSGVDSRGNPIVISGNHGRRVAEAVYSRSRVLAYVKP